MVVKRPSYPSFTQAEYKARQYKKKGNKFYKDAVYAIPGNNYPELKSIDLSKKPVILSEFIDLMQSLNELLIDPTIDIVNDHYCGGCDDYDCSCENSLSYRVTGKVEFIPDDKLKQDYESAALKDRTYKRALKEYGEAEKVKREEAEYKRFLKLKQKFEGR